MSWYTTTGLTVSADKAVAFAKSLHDKIEDYGDYEEPDSVTVHSDGSMTFLWKDRNHFEYLTLAEMLDREVGSRDYAMTVVDEAYSVEEFGSGTPCHEVVMTIEVWVEGEKKRLEDVI